MRILLTNDDGIYADGIQKLSEELCKDFETYVVAPDHERSATGHAITMHKPLRAEEMKSLHMKSAGAWAVNGTPSDCVKLAIEALLDDKPDLVISGINRGANLGTDVLYSGTVSAAVEAVLLGVPAMAVSLNEYYNPDFLASAKFSRDIVKIVIEKKLPESTLLNINIPAKELSKGVKVTKLGERKYTNSFEKRTDPRGRHYYWLAGELVKMENGEGTDVEAVKDGYISITPLKFNLTDEEIAEEIKNWSFPFNPEVK